MTRKKSNVKALALAVTCAILAGGGIGLEPVYAADVTYDVGSNQLKNGTTAIDTLTVGGVTIGGSGTDYGITIGDVNKPVMISDHDISETGSVHASIISSGINERMSDGKVVAQNGLYIGYDGTDITNATYDNSKFAVKGDDGSFKAANGKFTVSGSGAITADSLTLGTDYNVKQNIEAAKGRITAVEGDLNTNKTGLTALQGRVNGHDTEINKLKTKTEGITRVDGNSTTVDGVNFKEGAVSDVKSINSKLEFADDGIYLNKGNTKKQIKISDEGKIIIGTSSSAYDNDGFYAGGDDYEAAKAGMKSDGSLKATGFSVEGANGNTTVGGELSVAGVASFTKETTFAAGIKTNIISENTDGEGVKVDDVLLKDGGITATGDVTTTGALKGKTLGIGTNGSEFTVDENGNTTVGGTLDVTGATTLGSALNVTGKTTLNDELQVNGKATLKDELQVDKKATFGIAEGSKTEIEGDVVKTGRIETSKTQASNIGGVQLLDGQITANGMTIKGTIDLNNLMVKNELTVGDFGVNKTGAVTGLKSINGVTVENSGTGLTIGSATIGAANPFSSTGFKVDNVGNVEAVKVTANTITDGAGFKATGGNVTATGTVQGNTIYDGVGAKLENGKITANEGQIGSVVISAAGEVIVNGEIKASAFKVDEENYLNGNGITAKGGKIGEVRIEGNTLNIGSTTLDKAEGITTNKLKIDGMTLTGTSLDTGTADFEVNGVEFKQGQVTAMADKGFVAGTSSFKERSLIVDDNNKLEAISGLTTEKATVEGTLDVTGKATFGTGSDQTTINGKTITTDTLKANQLILGASGAHTVVVDKDGSLKAAGGKFEVDKDGALKAADGAFTVAKDGKTIFKKDDNNLSSINGGNIWAKATDAANSTSSELLHNYKGLHISGTQAGQTSAFDFDAATGISTFTGQDSTTTTINGSVITSTKATDDTGVLDGSNLTLKKGTNQTVLDAGKVTFKSDNAGEYYGTETTIDGGVITTDTLNVKRINLGKEMVNSDGTTVGSNLSIDEHGNIKAAGGNFTVAGTNQANSGALHNEVGSTSFDTTADGASMKFNNTAATGGVESKVAVEANRATVAAGDKASFVATTDNGGTATITGGTQTVTTTDKGTVFENSANNTAFVTGGATTTIINGNEITTGKITTDELVITGKGDAAGDGTGTGSLAFGGNGTIKSDVKKDGSTNNTQFTTDINGVNTMVTDGQTTTENKVTAAGNSNTVKQDDEHKSEFNQGLTSIGGVVTNGEIKVAQYLDGETGKLTNEVKDANGSSMLKQSSTGLTYTDSANTGNETRIDSGDVSIGAALDKDGNQLVDDGKEGINRINLSDLGQIDNLDDELKNRPEYKNGEEVGTAVGAINAEAAIRREEVARLDNRIDDVNNRVDKVGAMAAAIASLKSIGYDPQAPSEFSIGLGQYKGETGVAMGFFHYPNKNFMINVSLSTAGGETMGGIGATWRFGHKSPQKLLEEQREAQAKKELAAAEKYQAAAKLAKEAQERAEYAAKLARQAQVSADNAKAAADATQAKHFG